MTIIILDFGSQYTQLIAKTVRKLERHAIVQPHDYEPRERVDAIIISGGPQTVKDPDSLRPHPLLFPFCEYHKIPILGVCYGFQLMMHHYGGMVHQGGGAEYGYTTLNTIESKLFREIASYRVWSSHRDVVIRFPAGFKQIGFNARGDCIAVEHTTLPFAGIQYHPEVQHSACNAIAYFLDNIAHIPKLWTIGTIHEDIQYLMHTIKKDDHVICALSGGVDSTVTAAIIHQYIGERLHCVLVDNGLLRRDEARHIIAQYKNMGLNVVCIDHKEEMLKALKGITDPEEKRKIIGREFIKVFHKFAQTLDVDVKWLAQGTIYSDVIESGGTKNSHTIKSHHNIGGLLDNLGFQIIEPLRHIFKDEVRSYARHYLNIPNHLIVRQPFPGPGLAIRCPGEVTPEKLEIIRSADAILQEELMERPYLYNTIWQSFVILLPIYSVGVQGDQRSDKNCIVLRIVASQDAMTANWVPLESELLQHISTRITNEVSGVNRVLLDITNKPPSTIEWE